MLPDSSNTCLSIGPGDALVVVDPQNDFLSGGRLAVPFGNDVIPVLNGYLDVFKKKALPIFVSRDWHPANHCSFKEQGGDWPSHCVQNSEGARFAKGLDLPQNARINSKASSPEKEAYSDFDGTDFDQQLKVSGTRRLFVGGLATDYCVFHTVKDAIKNGYQVVLLEDAIRAVNVNPDDGQKAIDAMIQMGSQSITLDALAPKPHFEGALWTDLYQLTMMQGYFDQQMNATAVFEFFARKLPPERNFLVAAGLEQVLQYLETLRFTSRDLEWMQGSGFFSEEFISSLEEFRFTGDVHAMPEGTLFFPDEPILRITAPLPQGQLVETRIINLLQFQTLVASKAARMVLEAPGKTLIDFGFRRAHGAEAGLLAARASYLTGFQGTATVAAGAIWNIPVFGTMAHSFVMAHDDEKEAFLNFARSQPENVILLIDTYDTERGAKKVVELAPRLGEMGIRVKGVRLDSGDMIAHSRKVRAILDAGGLQETQIFASGDLDEYALRKFITQQAPVQGFRIGTRLTTSADLPFLNCAFKLQEYDQKARRKISDQGLLVKDTLVLEGETAEGEPLLQSVMKAGKRLAPPLPLTASRENTAKEIKKLPDSLRSLEKTPPYPVEISPQLVNLAHALDRKSQKG